jgi:hypothetical protein
MVGMTNVHAGVGEGGRGETVGLGVAVEGIGVKVGVRGKRVKFDTLLGGGDVGTDAIVIVDVAGKTGVAVAGGGSTEGDAQPMSEPIVNSTVNVRLIMILPPGGII